MSGGAERSTETLMVRISKEMREEIDARLEEERKTRGWLTLSDLIRELISASMQKEKTARLEKIVVSAAKRFRVSPGAIRNDLDDAVDALVDFEKVTK